MHCLSWRRHGAAFLPIAFLLGCGSDATSANGMDAGADGLGGGVADALMQLDAQTCVGDETACLFGTAHVGDGFVVSPGHLRASLYRIFPTGGLTELPGPELVAKDHTWAFSGLDPWAHYYLAIEPGFFADAGVSTDGGSAAVLTRVGPLSVPGNTGSPIAVEVKPVQLDVFEQGAPGAALQVETVEARVVEIPPGSSTVSIQVGATSTPVPYVAQRLSYLLQFTPPATPPAAQSTYQMTTSTTPSTWNLVADPPSFAATITQPAAAATVPAGQDLLVTWPLQPLADYVVVELFRQTTTPAWMLVYPLQSMPPMGPDVGQLTIPGKNLSMAGTYLLNVAFTKGNCPPTADGCVLASVVANEQLTVR